MRSTVPPVRLREANERPVRPDGAYVLYWMIATRRRRSNFALQRAVDWARDLGKPLLVLEALRSGYRWASDRLHTFVIQGMAANARAFDLPGVRYYPYVEPARGAGAGLLRALADRACLVVTDEFPCFFLPRMVTAAARKLPTALEVVDSCGLLPLRVSDRVFQRAYDFRRHVHRTLAECWADRPAPDPLRGGLEGTVRLPSQTTARWPPATKELLRVRGDALGSLPIDHTVPPSPVVGGAAAGHEVLDRFLEDRLPRYDEARNVPDDDVTSGLSPFLHFGHVSAHDVVRRIAQAYSWSPEQIDGSTKGSRSGWNANDNVVGFLDELIVWRELGYNMAALRNDVDRYDSLPAWARETLAVHANDRRDPTYGLETFAAAETHDELWNAAQRQLLREGRIHNYLRMLWGKKILEWSTSPEEAARIMIELNDKYALDGRDPNSYSGIFWVLGRYDRPWGPERPVFGKVRYMSSENTARKVRVTQYLKRYGPEE